MDTSSVCGPASLANRGITSSITCGLTATRITPGRLRQLVDERQDINAVVGEKIGDGLCRIGILHDHRAGIEAAGEQPREDRSAHLARAGEQQRTLQW